MDLRELLQVDVGRDLDNDQVKEDINIDEEGAESESQEDEDGMSQLGLRRWRSETDYSLIPLWETAYFKFSTTPSILQA